MTGVMARLPFEAWRRSSAVSARKQLKSPLRVHIVIYSEFQFGLRVGHSRETCPRADGEQSGQRGAASGPSTKPRVRNSFSASA
jgi:hypothetical protein